MSAGTLTLMDKVAFLAWVEDAHDMDAGALKVLRVVVMRLLGLEHGKPHNAWTTNGVLATTCRMHKRSVQRALRRLQALGLLVCHGFAGRGGRLVLHLPGVVGAAGTLKPRPLGDRTADGNTASKRRRGRHVNPVEKAASMADERRRPRHLNPVEDPKDKNLNPLEGARGSAAEPDAAPQPVVDEGQEGPPAGGLRPGLQEGPLARARLLARLNGIAAKMGRKARAELLHQLGEDRVQRWLRLQRERRDAQLVKEAVGVLASWLGVDRKQLGEAVAIRQGPRYTPPPPKPPLGKVPPSADGHPLRPVSLHEAAKMRKMAEAWDPEALRASAIRLGMIPKEPARLNGAVLR
jgi:hypothetical protein